MKKNKKPYEKFKDTTKEEYENNLAGNLPDDDENKVEVNDEYQS